ncbi:MAG: hypothetical protein WBM35_05620 [Candidatus Electrothrix sp.]
MKRYNVLFLLVILLVLFGVWAPSSFAGLGGDPVPNVEGLTLEDAERIYGLTSDRDYPLLFEVNAKSGNPNCVLIGPDCSKACPKSKIFYQSPLHIPNRDHSSTVRVDIYFDNNDVIVSRDPTC